MKLARFTESCEKLEENKEVSKTKENRHSVCSRSSKTAPQPPQHRNLSLFAQSTMAKVRFLDLVKPLQSVLPEVENPISKQHLSFDDRILYSLGVAVLFLLSQLPIAGVKSVNSDPFFHYRSLFGSERDSLNELGLLPILTAGFFWQFLSGLRIIHVNFNSKADRGAFQSLQKISAIFLAAIYAFALVFFTDYFNPNAKFESAISSTNVVPAEASSNSVISQNLFIWFQLVCYNTLLTYLVEILDKDYGFTSGSLLLIAVQGATKIISGYLDITVAQAGSKGTEFKGVLVQIASIVKYIMFFNYSSLQEFFADVLHLLNRSNLINFQQFAYSLVAFALIFYLNSFNQPISIKSKQVKTMAQNYPIKLFHNGALPLLFLYTILFNCQFINYVSYKFFNVSQIGISIVQQLITLTGQADAIQFIKKYIIGEFAITSCASAVTYPATGLLSYLQPPTGITSTIVHPINTIVYTLFSFAVIYFFSTTWSRISGSNGKDLAEFFQSQNLTILGKRDSNVVHFLNKQIGSASLTGGLVLFTIGTTFDLLGGKGYPNAVIVTVLIVFGFLESFFSELQQSGGSTLYDTAFGAAQGANIF